MGAQLTRPCYRASIIYKNVEARILTLELLGKDVDFFLRGKICHQIIYRRIPSVPYDSLYGSCTFLPISADHDHTRPTPCQLESRSTAYARSSACDETYRSLHYTESWRSWVGLTSHMLSECPAQLLTFSFPHCNTMLTPCADKAESRGRKCSVFCLRWLAKRWRLTSASPSAPVRPASDRSIHPHANKNHWECRAQSPYHAPMGFSRYLQKVCKQSGGVPFL